MIQGLILLAFAIFLVLAAIVTLTKYKKISNSGVEVEGIVFDLESSSTTNSPTLTFPVIRFLTKKNEWITQKASVSIIPGSYKKGQKITVVYQIDKPTVFFIKSNWTNAVLALMIIIGLTITILGIYILISSI
ncbi:MAG: DUF3592 domain-containing protein [Sediminibacterium magnilacihabitans]|jgi:cell shape-determining protein MreD|nr:DUF3592 domain-containing protein [Sediminibacterium magnilacihabitans]PQV56127.1 uncharacterized protein DUF3592 [Sediminibacterium magnilacihabitans]